MRARLSRRAITITALSLTALLGAAKHQPGTAAGNEILWDSYGVPHIRAANAEQVGWGFGYAQMQNHANLMLLLYGQARARAAEYWGAAYEDGDRLNRVMGVPARAREWYAKQTPSFKAYLDAFVAGVNAYAREHPEAIPDSLKVVLPITGIDVLAHGQRVINLSFVAWFQGIDPSARQWRNARNPSASPSPRPAPEPPGSNAWAIAPSHSASGSAMLVANPHLPWSDLFTFMEAQLTTPDMDLYGCTLVGSPVIAIGFNENIAWTHTVNTYDGADLYELTLTPDGASYMWDGSSRALETSTETMQVKQRDGSLVAKTLTIKRSVHGPVLAERKGQALAIRIAGLDRPRAAEEWWQMGRAKNLAEFERALRQLQMPMFNVIYAGRDGHIMYLYNAILPKRPRGDFSFWMGIIRGDSSSLLWSDVHGYDDLPRVVDPATGWVQNANDPPWTSTIPQTLDPSKFPAYFSPNSMPLRPQRSAKLVAEGAKVSFDEMVQRKHSTRVEVADRVLGDLIPAARAKGNDMAKRAADVLERWDRETNADSRGAVLFQRFWLELLNRSPGTPYARRWDSTHPLETPVGLADAALAVQALETAAADVEKTHGSLDVAWGAVNRLSRDSVDEPGNGTGGEFGVFRVIYYETKKDAGHMAASGGDSFVAAVEFSTPLKAKALLGYGNASQPGSPHRVDQLPFIVRKELRQVWRTKAEVEQHLEGRKTY